MKKKNRLLWYILFGLIYTLGTMIYVLCRWYHLTYSVGFKELLYTLLGPLQGTGSSVIQLILSANTMPVLKRVALYVIGCFLLAENPVTRWLWSLGGRIRFPGKLLAWLRRLGALACVVVLLFSVWYVADTFDVKGYIESLDQITTIYEEQYVNPAAAVITAPETKRNLIHIYLESMETTYMSAEEGGIQKDNLMPNLTQLARSHLYFDGTDTFSGFRDLSGTSWTMASLLAGTSGIPFAFPVEDNAMDTQEHFAPQLITLGDILHQQGYVQEFLCGSDASFGGRRKYFTQHGDYQIFDLFTAREKGYIEPDYYVWWGFEDYYLFQIARDEATRLYETGQPFNLTMLTVDTHHFGGYICDWCGMDYGASTADVVLCTDAQVMGFIDWCKEQPFWENTTIILSGDHPRMDAPLVVNAQPHQRTMYNCYINAAATVEGSAEDRIFTALDLFPTELEALGFDVAGDRLGLGVSLFSAEPTLAETMGVEELDAELNKHSDYYLNRFYLSK